MTSIEPAEDGGEEEEAPSHRFQSHCRCKSCQLQLRTGFAEPFGRGDVLYERLLTGPPPPTGDRLYRVLPLPLRRPWCLSALICWKPPKERL